MIIEVRRFGGDGSIRRVRLDTAERYDAARGAQLVDLAGLQVPPPPPYHPEPGQPVYEVRAGDRAAQIAGSYLREPVGGLVSAVLAEGRTARMARGPA